MRVSILVALGLCAASWTAAQPVPFRLHGQGWAQVGRIMQSTDTVQNGPTTGPYIASVDDSWMQHSGAQFTLTADLSPNLEGAFGFGAYQVTHALARTGDQGMQPKLVAISLTKSFVSEARLTYYRGEKEAPDLSVTMGNFVYNYNRDVKNLGLYLLRGPVYPGLLFGGFKDFSADTTKANQLGIHVHHAWGDFSHDLILNNEKDLPPTFDWSLAYIAKYKVLENLDLGAGINFYRLIPYNSKLETVDNYENLDTLGVARDTVRYTHQGIKLMGMFSLDLKPWIGTPSMGPNDLKLYGEAAVLGVKDYGTVYDDIMDRIPVMLGVNLPAFGILDLLALEVEWYGSPYRNDLANIGNPAAVVADWTVQNRPKPSPLPVTGAFSNGERDNWKWSLLLEKTVREHIRISGQVANDHYRPAAIAIGDIFARGGNSGAFTTPEDWYFMLRLGYFF